MRILNFMFIQLICIGNTVAQERIDNDFLQSTDIDIRYSFLSQKEVQIELDKPSYFTPNHRLLNAIQHQEAKLFKIQDYDFENFVYALIDPAVNEEDLFSYVEKLREIYPHNIDIIENSLSYFSIEVIDELKYKANPFTNTELNPFHTSSQNILSDLAYNFQAYFNLPLHSKLPDNAMINMSKLDNIDTLQTKFNEVGIGLSEHNQQMRIIRVTLKESDFVRTITYKN